MQIHPNPPRLVTVGISVALVVVGLVLALPLQAGVDLLKPIGDLIGGYGLRLDRDLGYLCLFGGNALLVAGSLLPGI